MADNRKTSEARLTPPNSVESLEHYIGRLNRELEGVIEEHIVVGKTYEDHESFEFVDGPLPIRCKDHRSCTNDKCPAYHHENSRCWLIAGTHCRGEIQGEFANKYKDCSQCSFFREASTTPQRMLYENIHTVLYNLVEANRELSRLATRDSLTGLRNRLFFEEAIQLETSKAERSGSSLGLIIVDVDGLKEVNDIAGHAAGDELLQSAARLLQENVRSCDLVVRYGGDEFLILTPDASSHTCEEMRERLQSAIDRANTTSDGEQPKVSLSIGYSLWQPGRRLDDVFREADTMMYQDKARKGGTPRRTPIPSLAKHRPESRGS